MFESILEKILVNSLGKFIEGLDSNSLKMSIWSGDISIGNIAVKREVFSQLQLPINMKFSYVGKLVLKIPWKSLGSSPVEVLLEDIFVILEPVTKDAWVPIDFMDVQQRIQFMESVISDYMNKITETRKNLEGQPQAQEDEGMVGRLTNKIIDNIQV